jgi:hypothetical protein
MATTMNKLRRVVSTITVFSAAAVYCIGFACSSARSQSPVADLKDTIHQESDRDPVAERHEGVDRREVYLSPKAYRAIRAVEVYREGTQRHQLTNDERDFDNFDIFVQDGSAGYSFSEDVKEPSYLVSLYPRLQPGEPYAFDYLPRIGRIAVYLVRKSDYGIIRSKLGRSPENRQE